MKREILRLEHIDLFVDQYQALSDLNLNIFEGELVNIIGHLGCGTEQLVALLTGELQASSGKILFEEKPYALNRRLTSEKLGIFLVERQNILIPFCTGSYLQCKFRYSRLLLV